MEDKKIELKKHNTDTCIERDPYKAVQYEIIKIRFCLSIEYDVRKKNFVLSILDKDGNKVETTITKDEAEVFFE